MDDGIVEETSRENIVSRLRRRSRQEPESARAEATAQDLLATPPFGDDPDLTPRTRARRLPRLTTYLGAGVLVVAGFLGGVQAQKYLGATSGSAGLPANIADLIAQRGGQPGAQPGGQDGGAPGPGELPLRGGAAGGPGGMAGGNTTVGTVKLVDGDTVYLETTGGGVVTVNTTDSTEVSLTKEGTTEDLTPGASVVVTGERADDGTVSAAEIREGG